MTDRKVLTMQINMFRILQETPIISTTLAIKTSILIIEVETVLTMFLNVYLLLVNQEYLTTEHTQQAKIRGIIRTEELVTHQMINGTLRGPMLLHFTIL
jgi:hypothetical protein